MLRRIQVIGYVVKDAIVNTTQNGARIPVNFKIAINEKHGDTEKAFFYPCVIWADKDKATKTCERIKKGGLMWIDGIPDANLWTNKEGKAVAELKIDVKSFRTMSKSESVNSQTENTSSANNNDDDSNDLPF